MKKRMASLVATGVMAVGALAGTAATADAATATATVYSGITCPGNNRPCYDWEGPFPISQNCVTYVASIHKLGVWDCEYYTNPWWGVGSGWYATSYVII